MTALLLRNANVFTRGVTEAQALVIESGRIAWLGTNAQSASFDHLPTFDCGGLWLAPAFGDGHVHVTNAGLELNSASLKSATSADQLGAVIAEIIASSTEPVVIAHGWDDTHWEYQPQSADIEHATAVYASRVDVHSALINRALISKCPGIENLEGWHESGRVTKAAHALARQTAYSLVSDSAKEKARARFLSEAASNGIVAVDEMAGPIVSSEADAAAVRALGESPSRPDVFVWWGDLLAIEAVQRLGAYGCGGDLFVDGSLGSKTALLRSPYETGEIGARYIAEVDVARHIAACVEAGLPTGFHAIGDAALDSVVDGYAAAARTFGATKVASGRHRIEHAEMLDDKHRAICAELGITLSMQPQFDSLWASAGEMYSQRIGNRYDGLNDFAAAATAGVAMVLGSDAPVTACDPWAWIAAASQAHNPDHRISARAAFSASTRGFWRNHGVEDCGTIEVGAVASLALWEVDAFDEMRTDPTIKRWSTDPRSGNRPLPDLSNDSPRCRMTWKRGTTIFDGMNS